jgi:hypothetical protein
MGCVVVFFDNSVGRYACCRLDSTVVYLPGTAAVRVGSYVTTELYVTPLVRPDSVLWYTYLYYDRFACKKVYQVTIPVQ